MIYVNFFDENKKNDLENISCYWQYFCHGNFHFCQYGCSLKKKLKKGYNLLNSNDANNKKRQKSFVRNIDY
ncbi:hypothetical protein [Plasmodium yoelii yoelii]|uniref:Uncharacterized protein n=1 Tax=Plasmodium yoelii yoelii TaxID=73239 RepID=Q7RPJ5_PLAYO|nr:hypothetical protein [Plasmodium yoelii yoelii]